MPSLFSSHHYFQVDVEHLLNPSPVNCFYFLAIFFHFFFFEILIALAFKEKLLLSNILLSNNIIEFSHFLRAGLKQMIKMRTPQTPPPWGGLQ